MSEKIPWDPTLQSTVASLLLFPHGSAGLELLQMTASLKNLKALTVVGKTTGN